MDHMEPVAKKRRKLVPFGKVDGEDRGAGLMDPPLMMEDDYYWLRSDTRDDPEVLDYLKEENTYTNTYMADTHQLQEELFNEIKSRIKETDETYPYPAGDGGWNGPYRYFTRTEEGKNYPLHCRRDMRSGTDRVLLDVNILAEGLKHCDVETVIASPNHQILAYCVDSTGNEVYDLHFRDLYTGQLLDFKIPNVRHGDFKWSQDSTRVYFTTGDETHRSDKVWQCRLPAPGCAPEPEILYQEPDVEYSVEFHMSDDGEFLFVGATSFDTDEWYYLRLGAGGAGGAGADADADTTLRIVRPRTPGLKYSVDAHHGNLLILTNEDGATDFKLMTASFEADAEWVPLAGPPPGVGYLKSVACFENHLVISLRTKCVNTVGILDYADGTYSNWRLLDFEEPIYDVVLGDNEIYDTHRLWLQYTSMTQPQKLIEYDMSSFDGEMQVLHQKATPNYDPSLYRSEILWAPSYYGVRVPISVVYRIDRRHAPTTPQPFHLYGYGSYGLTIDPEFRSGVVSLLDRGFIFGVAHVRGGADLGYQWYLDGKMHNKMNTFLDFISCAEFLIRERWTTKELLSVEGRSAGGLLMGACLTMRPDLFNTVVAGVPFVEVLGTMSDPTIPLTTDEWQQWGNPNKREDYLYMRQYSPYDNIRVAHYPNTLVTAGLHDPRVAYWEGTKLVAKLRSLKTDDNVHLLKVEMEHGHFGNTERYTYIRETAFKYAFVLKTLRCAHPKATTVTLEARSADEVPCMATVCPDCKATRVLSAVWA